MTIQTDIYIEVTDTFGGEANYAWFKRYKVECKQGENYSDIAAIRRAKKEAGWNGLRCKVSKYGDMIELRPYGQCIVMFITFHSFGNASN